jgi:hypothetical protein
MDMHDSSVWKHKLAILDKRISAFPQGYRQNLALLGDSEEEIAYLLEEYLNSCVSREVAVIHADTRHIDQRDFFKSIAASILSEYLRKAEPLDNLILEASPILPSTTHYIKEVTKKTSAPGFLESLELVNKFIIESGRKCVFIVENFLGLRRLFPHFHNEFSKFIVIQRNCMVILTSAYVKESEKFLATELNVLFGNFENVYLNEMSFVDNYVYMKQALTKFPCSPFFISFFVNIMSSNTMYYDLMQRSIREHYRQDAEESSIVTMLYQSLYTRQSYLFQKFINKINFIENNCKDFYSLTKILIALSNGYARRQELSSLHIVETRELQNKLQKLCDMNYVDSIGDLYKVKDSLFAFWLSHVFIFTFFSPLRNPVKNRILFEKKAQETLALFKETFYKDNVKRVLELISSFKDDTLRFGRFKYKLPCVERTRIVSYPEKNFHLIVGEGKEIIFVGIKDACTEDKDILDFLEQGSSVKGKGVRKIFISLDKVSSAVKLVAKNNKLPLWDIDEINRIMTVYNKPIISYASQEHTLEGKTGVCANNDAT